MMGALQGTGRQDALEEWLGQHGFTSNPFAQREAGMEARLDEYFIEPPGFAEVRGQADMPHSAFVFAPRGGGKTACRVMIERACRPHDQDSDVLAVPYLDYGDLLSKGEGVPRIDLLGHVKTILRCGLRVLVTEFLAMEESINLPVEKMSLLRSMASQYAPDLLSPLFLLPLLRKEGALRADPDISKLVQAISEQRVRDVLGPTLDPNSPFGEWVVCFVDAHPLPPSAPTPHHLLNGFAELALYLGVRTVYVLVDGLDEHEKTASNPDVQVAFLTPLVSDLPLLKLPHLAFKFFLPIELQTAMDDLADTGRLHCLEILPCLEISWRDDDLRKLLRQRLLVFSKGEVESLRQLFADPEAVGDVDARLVRWANGSPRVLLELGDTLITTHCQQTEPPLMLTVGLWEGIEKRYEVEYAPRLIPLLCVDEKEQQVLIGKEPISEQLTPLEYKLLLFLYHNAKKLRSKDDVWREIYCEDPDGVSDTAIDTLVSRLRKKIEQDPRNPVYLKTERGRGYRLVNVG